MVFFMAKSTDIKIKSFINNIKLQKNIDYLSKKYKNKRILLYGAGVFALEILNNYDLSKLNIIGISDKIFWNDNNNFNDYKTFSPEQIKLINPDVIIITAFDYLRIKKFFKTYYPAFNSIKTEHILPKNFLQRILIPIFDTYII